MKVADSKIIKWDQNIRGLTFRGNGFPNSWYHKFKGSGLNRPISVHNEKLN